MNLYITADVVGKADHGAGSVTFNEAEALKALGPLPNTLEVFDRERMLRGKSQPVAEPWGWDYIATNIVHYWRSPNPAGKPESRLAHFYAGTFSATIAELKRRGSKITYTAAAHDVAASRRAHEELGVPYNYPHLTDPKLWERYLAGYKAADVLIVPSRHSERVMRGFGCTNRIEVIPHGVNLPACVCVLTNPHNGVRSAHAGCPKCKGAGIAPVAPPPARFTVGYLGNCGAPDKGLRYLFAAWKQLNYPDAVLRVAGHDSLSRWVMELVSRFFVGDDRCDLVAQTSTGQPGGQLLGAGIKRKSGAAVELCGWVPNVSDFYNSLSLYVQPSVTEGFGLEVLEAMAHGRPVLCSIGAGAADCIQGIGSIVTAGDTTSLAASIEWYKKVYSLGDGTAFAAGQVSRDRAANYTWDKVRARYQTVWRSLL